MATLDALIARAQKRGVNIAQAEDDTWHGSYVWEGQEYGLDNEDPEALVIDMEALTEIFAQDDTYQLDYNEDLDRYIITVEGSEQTFSDQVLAKAFAAAKDDVMGRAQRAEDERKSRAKAEEPAPAKATRSRKPAAANNDQPQQVDEVVTGILEPVIDALSNLVAALRRAAQQLPQQGQGFTPAPEQPIEPEPFVAPTPKKRGLKKS